METATLTLVRKLPDVDDIVECKIVPAMDQETKAQAEKDGVPVWAAHVSWLWRDGRGNPAPILGVGTSGFDSFIPSPTKPTPSDAIAEARKAIAATWDQPKASRTRRRKKG